MQSDEVIWQIINHQFCSFKTKLARERNFCQNPYNVSGLCVKSACPLANSRYATIKEEDGVCYLYMKTAERAHSPKNLWEKIKLPANYVAALAIVSKELEHFPKYLVHRNKQRLTKIHQMIIRMRKLKLKTRPKIVTTNTKVDRREIGKERKALRAAQLDRAIEKELLERLKQVSEDGIYNFPERNYSKVLEKAAQDEGVSQDFEDLEEQEEEEEQALRSMREQEREEEEGEGERREGEGAIEYIEDLEESDEEEDMEDMDGGGGDRIPLKGKRKASDAHKKMKALVNSSIKKKKKSLRKTELEYEYEREGQGRARERVSNDMLFNF